MDKQGFEIDHVVLRPPRFKKDKSATISLDTGEMSAEDKLAVLENDGLLGTLIFVPESIIGTPPKIDAAFEGKKPSKRYMDHLYVYWKQQGSKGNFQEFYSNHMEKLINAVKDKLD